MPNLADLLSRAAADRPSRVAIKRDETELSYTALDQAATHAAGFLSAKGCSQATVSASCCPTSRTSPPATTARCGQERLSCQ
jgi:non-ribosomal peptide synthetase component F